MIETLGRIFVYPTDDFSTLLAAELSLGRDADCLLIVPALQTSGARPRRGVARERPTRVVYVGRPTSEEQGLVDVVVPADFDWRRRDALAVVG